MQAVARNAAVMSERLGEQSAAVPEVANSAIAALDSLDAVMQDVRRTTPELPRLTRSVADSTEALPVLLLQSQQTLTELEALIRQLRSSWLLGGADAPETPPSRVPPLEVTP